MRANNQKKAAEIETITNWGRVAMSLKKMTDGTPNATSIQPQKSGRVIVSLVVKTERSRAAKRRTEGEI